MFNVYFQLTNFYGYGPTYDVFAEALEEAGKNWHSEFVHQVIDIRIKDESGDRLIKRIELVNPLKEAKSA